MLPTNPAEKEMFLNIKNTNFGCGLFMESLDWSIDTLLFLVTPETFRTNSGS